MNMAMTQDSQLPAFQGEMLPATAGGDLYWLTEVVLGEAQKIQTAEDERARAERERQEERDADKRASEVMCRRIRKRAVQLLALKSLDGQNFDNEQLGVQISEWNGIDISIADRVHKDQSSFGTGWERNRHFLI